VVCYSPPCLNNISRPGVQAAIPTAAIPTAAIPTAAIPTTAIPTTAIPTAAILLSLISGSVCNIRASIPPTTKMLNCP
jgi:hypothetical protein